MHPNQGAQKASRPKILTAPSYNFASSSTVTVVTFKPLVSLFASSSNEALTAWSATELSADATPSSAKTEYFYKDAPDNEQTSSVANLKTSPGVRASFSDSSTKAAANICVKIISSIKPAFPVLSTKPATGEFHLKPSIKTLKEPVILAILEYQRQNRYFPIPNYTSEHYPTNCFDPFKSSDSLSARPSSPSQDSKQPLTFTNCNECQTGADGVYSECHHPEDDGEYDNTVNFDRLGEHIQPRLIDSISQQNPKSIDSIDYEMLNCRNLTALLSENTDEHASHFVVFTCHGTLLGYSETMKIKDARKVSALAGVTWRTKEAELLSDPGVSVGLPSLLLETLSLNTKANGRLASMVVESEGMMAAVAYVKETILVAALVPLPASTATKKKSARKQGKAKQFKESKNDSNNESSTTPTADSSNEEPTLGASTANEAQNEGSSAKGKEKDSTTTTPPPSQSQPGLSRMRILTLKAEGMSAALQDDLQNFKMPEGAH